MRQIKELELERGPDGRAAGRGYVEFTTREILIEALQIKELVRMGGTNSELT